MGITERKAREFQRREQEILKSAFALFSKHDFYDVTIEMIAEEAEIGKGTFYKHFKSKDEILAQLFLERNKVLIARYNAIPQDLPTLDRIKALVQTHIDFCLEDPDTFKTLFKCEQVFNISNLGPTLKERVREDHEEKTYGYQGLIQKGINEGLFLDMPAIDLLCILLGTLSGTIEKVLAGPFGKKVTNKDRLFEQLIYIVLRGVLKDQSGIQPAASSSEESLADQV